MTVGFAGIGRMGLPMARSILAAGLPLVVWNRTPDRCSPLVAAGATAVDTPAELSEADVVVTMLSDGAAVRSVLISSGLLAELRPGSIVVDTSTIGPQAAVELAAAALAEGVLLLDAPVSGSVSVAEAAQLSAMVGGDADAYARASPVLDAMTKGHLLIGPSGSGAAMKLALNAMVAVTNEAVAETLTLAEQFGIEPERAYDVLASSALASPFVLYKRDAFLRPEAREVAFTTSLMRKDVALAELLADELGVRMPALAAAAHVLDEAISEDLADADMAAVIGLLARRNLTHSTVREER